MPRYGLRRRMRPRRKLGNSVIHVPSTMSQTLATKIATVIVIESPSIFAAGSASDNIEAQDKDRTVNVGHHLGTLNVSFSCRNASADGVVEYAILKVERQSTTPVLGTHPIPTSAEIDTQGLQQAVRLANPGKVFHYSARAYTLQISYVHNMRVSPAKFKLSKVKAGDHWILLVFNRGGSQITFDVQMRYKEYE